MLRNWIGAFIFGVVLMFSVCSVSAQTLSIPPRPGDAMSGSEFVTYITSMDLETREEAILDQVELGNVPDFLRTLVPVSVTEYVGGQNRTAIYYVTCEYVCIGSDSDYFLTPMTPILGQRVADFLGCNLPTRKIVDDIHSAATVKLTPSPIAPSPAMTTVPVFADHNATVWSQRLPLIPTNPLGELVGGHKKDVVVTPQLAANPGKVAIYGWHYTNGTPIQPLYLGHIDSYADYSHGIRLVQLAMTVDASPTTVPDVLADPDLAGLLSDEGAFTDPRYPLPAPPEGFPYNDIFPSTGRQLASWTDRFTTPVLSSFSPAAPGGDGTVLIVSDPSGGIDTTRLGDLTDGDYYVECYIYCNYRPELSADGYERVGIFVRDDGNGMFEGISSGGVQGNNYALTWDSHDGSVRCLLTVDGVPFDMITPAIRNTSAWRKFRIEVIGSVLTFELDDDVILSTTDGTFSQGQFGIGYHEYFLTNSNILGTYADNFSADEMSTTGCINWEVY